MSRCRCATFFGVLPIFLIACGDDQSPESASGSGGALIFGTGGGAGSGATSTAGGAGNGGATGSAGGNTATGGTTSTNGGNSSTGGTNPSNGGNAGNGASGGISSTGGRSAATGGAQNAGGGPTGLPPGSLCANDTNCSQSGGAAVCCAIPGCGGPCECRLQANCPTNGQFLECNTAADCAAYGGGKICCKATSGGQSMQYCTKSNGCPGTILP